MFETYTSRAVDELVGVFSPHVLTKDLLAGVLGWPFKKLM